MAMNKRLCSVFKKAVESQIGGGIIYLMATTNKSFRMEFVSQ